jgi:hypothetical protein
VGEQPTIIFLSSCECQGFHGKNRWIAKTDLSPVPSDKSAIQSVTPNLFRGNFRCRVPNEPPRVRLCAPITSGSQVNANLQNPTIADKLKKADWRLAPAVQTEITKNE